MRPSDYLRLLLVFGSSLFINDIIYRPGRDVPRILVGYYLLVTLVLLPGMAYYVVAFQFPRVSASGGWKRHAQAGGVAILLSFLSAAMFIVWMVVMYYQIPD